MAAEQGLPIAQNDLAGMYPKELVRRKMKKKLTIGMRKLLKIIFQKLNTIWGLCMIMAIM